MSKNIESRFAYAFSKKIIFGGYPTQDIVNYLVDEKNVKYFVDLTFQNEKHITPYKTDKFVFHFPIKDGYVPSDKIKFIIFVLKVSEIICSLSNKERVYIHCKGGHSRSGILIAILLCKHFGFSPKLALEYTTLYHSKRKHMRNIYYCLKCPNRMNQRQFVYECTTNFYFNRPDKNGFSNFTRHNVYIPELNITCPTAEKAYRIYKDPLNIKHVEKLVESKRGIKLGKNTLLTKESDRIKLQIMHRVIKLKFDQHPGIKAELLNTYLRPIIYTNNKDSFFGVGKNKNTGKNILGIILVSIRNEYFDELKGNTFNILQTELS